MQIWRPGDSEDSRVHKQHGIFGVASVWFGILEGDKLSRVRRWIGRNEARQKSQQGTYVPCNDFIYSLDRHSLSTCYICQTLIRDYAE